MKVKIKLIGDTPIPKKGSGDAACYDVTAMVVEQKEPNLVKVYLGIHTEIPRGKKGVIVPRSSFTQKGWIMQNSPAQIDSDYRGEWMLKFEAIPTGYGEPIEELLYPNFPYKVGDRVAQIFFENVDDTELEIVSDLAETVRGSGGFGSTGI
jgi:dUTP pyrophosphatase